MRPGVGVIRGGWRWRLVRRALANICVFVLQLDSSEALIRSQNYPLI